MALNAKKIFANSFLILISIFFTLLISETALRIFFPQFKIMRRGLFTYDEKKGYCLIKNLNLNNQIITNQYGYRGDEVNSKADCLILALGDSNTFGDGVSQKEDYPSLLKKSLQKKTKKIVEVINAGVPAYGWLEEYEVLQEVINHFHVSFLIFQISWNDINDNGMDIPKYLIDPRGNLIFFNGKVRPGGYGEWGMKKNKFNSLELFALKHSHLAALFFGQWNKTSYFLNRKKIDEQIEKYKWATSEKTLKKIKELVDKNQIIMLAVIHPGSEPARLLKRNDMNKKIKEMLKRYRISYIDLNEPLQGMKDADDLYLKNDAHFNKKGYEWMVNVIEEQLINMLPGSCR